MSDQLLHQLPRPVARSLASELAELPLEEARARCDTSHPDAVLPPIGGSPAPPDLYRHLCSELDEVIRRCEGEHPEDDRACRRAFDTSAARILTERLQLQARVASDPDVWSFICCVAAPHVVRWRFPDSGIERFIGGVRNTLQRLHVRGVVLHNPDAEDPLALLGEMPEDALVQIFERPAVWKDRTHARVIVECLLQSRSGATGRFNFQTLVRRTLLTIRQSMPIASLSALPEDLQRDTIMGMIADGLRHVSDK